MAARCGYDSARSDPGGLAGASLGAGVVWRSLQFDLAWSPGGALGDTFQYSLLVRFGGERRAISRVATGWR